MDCLDSHSPRLFILSVQACPLQQGRGSKYFRFQWPSASDHHRMTHNKQTQHQDEQACDTDICQPWSLSWLHTGLGNGQDPAEPSTTVQEILVLLQGTGSFEWSTPDCGLPVKGTCCKDKKLEKRKRQGVNKNRNWLNTQTDKILNESGPSMSRNISFEIEHPLPYPCKLMDFLFSPH